MTSFSLSSSVAGLFIFYFSGFCRRVFYSFLATWPFLFCLHFVLSEDVLSGCLLWLCFNMHARAWLTAWPSPLELLFLLLHLSWPPFEPCDSVRLFHLPLKTFVCDAFFSFLTSLKNWYKWISDTSFDFCLTCSHILWSLSTDIPTLCQKMPSNWYISHYLISIFFIGTINEPITPNK